MDGSDAAAVIDCEHRAPRWALCTGDEPRSGRQFVDRIEVADIAQRQCAEPRDAQPKRRVERRERADHPRMRIAALGEWEQHELEILRPAFAGASFHAGNDAAYFIRD